MRGDRGNGLALMYKMLTSFRSKSFVRKQEKKFYITRNVCRFCVCLFVFVREKVQPVPSLIWLEPNNNQPEPDANPVYFYVRVLAKCQKHHDLWNQKTLENVDPQFNILNSFTIHFLLQELSNTQPQILANAS